MNPDVLDEVLSSNVRLAVEAAIAVRPRTLGELASISGITVQGVLRHLKRLEELGLVEERKLPIRTLKARTVYAARGELVGNYSTPDLTVVKPTERIPPRTSQDGDPDPEKMAAEVIVLRRRVKDQARKLGRTIDELVDEQEALRSGLDALTLTVEERLILEVVLTEETLDDGFRVLSRFYGIEDRRSIDKALAKVKR